VTESNPAANERLASIKHVVVLMMENRSFDQMLGYLMRDGMPKVDGLRGDEVNEDDQGTAHPVTPATMFEPLEKFYDPCHGRDCVAEQLAGGNQGFVKNFIATRPSGRILEDEYRDLVMRYYRGENLPVYDALARAFCVCDAWHSSVPGDTWPNRLYAMSGRQAKRAPPGWLERIRASLPGGLKKALGSFPIYEVEAFTRLLDRKQWRWYSHDPATLRMADKLYRDFRRSKLKDFYGLQRDNFAYFDRRRVSNLTEWIEGEVTARDSFLDDVARGQLRDVSWIDPNFVDVSVLEAISNDDHPPSSVLNGQSLVLEVYEALYKSKAWEETLLVILYDEHGGFYDHVAPPAVDDDPEFKTLGVRVPAIVVGPRVGKQVCHSRFDHTTLIKTILTRFAGGDGSAAAAAIAAMPARVGKANDLGELLADQPRSELPNPREIRASLDGILAAMHDARRAAENAPSPAPDGAGQHQEFHEFQEEFLRFAGKMHDKGLPTGQP
jgi:phospholipase C